MNAFPLEFFPQCKHLEWLTNYLGGWQFGEQGILRELFHCLKLQTAAEIGAGDGTTLPLSIGKIKTVDQSMVLYESESESRQKLALMYPKSHIFGCYIDQTVNCDLVVIDIDSNDSRVMQRIMQRDKPVVIMCEHMDRHYPITTSTPSSFPEWILGHELLNGFKIQDTAETLHAMASKLGYERIGFNRCNSFFVRQDRFTDLFR